MDRRSFLGQAAAGAVLFGLGISLRPRAARATWGDLPAGVAPVLTPGGQPFKILEVFMSGGFSAWETFYVRPPGARDRWRGYGTDAEFAAYTSWACNTLGTASAPPLSCSRGREFSLGPATRPLWDGPFANRVRIVVLAHDLLPHEAAVPYCLTGFRLGNPNQAGMGTYIESRNQARVPRNRPYSYFLLPNDLPPVGTSLIDVASATGAVPGAQRPLVLRLPENPANLPAALARDPGLTGPDALLEEYRRQYARKLGHSSFPGGARSRSKAFDAYSSSVSSLTHAGEIQAFLRGLPELTAATAGPTASVPCPQDGFAPHAGTFNSTAINLRIAADLLAPADGAKYVGILDLGLPLVPNLFGYDTHDTKHVWVTQAGVWNVLATLRALVESGRIDLSTTLIALTTEFGREPERDTRGGAIVDGRDHWPQGYVNVLIGGPVVGGVLGSIQDSAHPASPDPSDGYAAPGESHNPADLRGALLLAAGIDPFASPGGFAVHDFSFPGDEILISRGLRSDILGLATP